VRVPDEVGQGKAKITLLPTLLPALTVPNLTPATFYIPVVGSRSDREAIRRDKVTEEMSDDLVTLSVPSRRACLNNLTSISGMPPSPAFLPHSGASPE